MLGKNLLVFHNMMFPNNFLGPTVQAHPLCTAMTTLPTHVRAKSLSPTGGWMGEPSSWSSWRFEVSVWRFDHMAAYHVLVASWQVSVALDRSGYGTFFFWPKWPQPFFPTRCWSFCHHGMPPVEVVEVGAALMTPGLAHRSQGDGPEDGIETLW